MLCTVSSVYFAGNSKQSQRSFYVFTEEQCKSTTTATEPCSPKFKGVQPEPRSQSNGLFPPSDSDSDSDSVPNPIVTLYCAELFPLVRIWIGIQIPFLNGYCSHFRDRSLSQGQISIPITYI